MLPAASGAACGTCSQLAPHCEPRTVHINHSIRQFRTRLDLPRFAREGAIWFCVVASRRKQRRSCATRMQL
eukprot:g2834.t1